MAKPLRERGAPAPTAQKKIQKSSFIFILLKLLYILKVKKKYKIIPRSKTFIQNMLIFLCFYSKIMAL